MYDMMVCLQSLQCQRPDPGSDATLSVRKLHAVLECETLSDEVVVHQLESATWEQVNGGFEVASIPGALGEREIAEAMAGNVGECSGEDGGFSGRERWLQGLVL